MNEGDAPAALAHVEGLLAETYRRELEREENIWRSLPFFVATLALELTALFQVVDRLPPFDTPAGWVSLACIGASGLSSIAALGFLAGSMFPASFEYMPGDADLLTYTRLLILEEEAEGSASFNALGAVQAGLAEQYASATDHNRSINRRRERRRSIAGLATIAAVLSTLLLVTITFVHYVPRHLTQGTAHGRE